MDEIVKNTNKSYAEISKTMKKEHRQLFIKRFLKSKLVLTGFVIVIVALIVSIFAPLIAQNSPFETNPAERLQGPSSNYIFGTDDLGRDLFSRVIYGIKESILVSFSVTMVSSLIGVTIGLYSAYYGILDHILMRINDGLMAFPSILLAIAIMAAMGPSTKNVVIALSAVYIPLISRVVRSSALVIKEQTYIEGMHSLGSSSTRIIWKHIAPNTFAPLLVQATFVFAVSVITEAMLSFLGAGIPAPNPSLGNILYDGKNVITKAWWMTVFPGVAILLITVGFNMFGDGLRDALDPRLKN